MRERLDCAVFHTVLTEEQVRSWPGSHMGGRLNIQAIPDPPSVAHAGSTTILPESGMVLRRYDACLLPVSEQNLGWVRTALLAAKGRVRTPLVAVVHQIKAPALDDLFRLGLADFVRDPLCFEELRARIEHLLDRGPYRGAPDRDPSIHLNEGKALDYPRRAEVDRTLETDLCDNILERSGGELDAYAHASASRCASSRESFKAAKSKVIERFERAYITAALGRHSGNIAMAARAAQKHRRAFWALMRKHQIDAAPYREPPQNRPTRG